MKRKWPETTKFESNSKSCLRKFSPLSFRNELSSFVLGVESSSSMAERCIA